MAAGKTDVWYSMYPADYLKDTMDLTLEEDAFYTRALHQVYINRGRIPADPARLQRLLRVTRAQFKKCAWILEKYFFRDGEHYGNKRADEEIRKAQNRSETASANGVLGNQKRWGKGGKEGRDGDRGSDGKSDPDSDAEAIANPSPENRSSQSQSDPPCMPPPEFRTVSPTLYAAMGIAKPSISEEAAAYEAWQEIKASGETAQEFAYRATRYRQKWPDMAFTFRAVLRNWSQLAPPRSKPAPILDDYELDSEREVVE